MRTGRIGVIGVIGGDESLRATSPKANKSSEIIICVFSLFGAPLHRTESLSSRTETQSVQDGKSWPLHGCNMRCRARKLQKNATASRPHLRRPQQCSVPPVLYLFTQSQSREVGLDSFAFCYEKNIAHTVHVQRYVQSIFETLHTKANCLSRAPHPGPTANDVNSPFFLTISLGHGARVTTRATGFSQERFY